MSVDVTRTRPNADQADEMIEVMRAGLDNIAQAIVTGVPMNTLDSTYAAILNGENTTRIFKKWWPLSDNNSDTKYERLCRFARMMVSAWGDKKYTLKYYVDTVSGSSVMTPQDDLINKPAAQLCTENTTLVVDWADEDPFTWYVRANALSLSDGTMNVLAVEGVDDEFDVYGELGPVYTFSAALWVKLWSSGDYHYQSWSMSQLDGYAPYGGDVAPDNTKRDLTWHPSFPGGLDSNGNLGSGVGQKPANRKSAIACRNLARALGSHEGLWNDADTIWVLDMWQLRHFDLENSDICNGCQSYNFQYTVAVAEDGVKRVLLTAAQAANLQVGSNIMIGSHPSGTNTDRNTAANYDLADNATILSKEVVTVNNTEYTALNLDLSANINVPATAYVSTAPWSAGNTENLPGHKDGCCYSLTAGRNPLRVQGVEVMDGAYTIGLDPLYNVTNFANSKGDYAVYECKDCENLSDSVSATGYSATGITYSQMPQGWQYVKKFVHTLKAVLFPEKIGGSSTTYFKSAFYGTGSAGVRCPWRFGILADDAYYGLACEHGLHAPGFSSWSGRGRLGGSGKKRGEWPA